MEVFFYGYLDCKNNSLFTMLWIHGNVGQYYFSFDFNLLETGLKEY